MFSNNPANPDHVYLPVAAALLVLLDDILISLQWDFPAMFRPSRLGRNRPSTRRFRTIQTVPSSSSWHSAFVSSSSWLAVTSLCRGTIGFQINMLGEGDEQGNDRTQYLLVQVLLLVWHYNPNDFFLFFGLFLRWDRTCLASFSIFGLIFVFIQNKNYLFW